MSYRTIKRALGETNLERKCRILFGVCLGILIFGAFLWVDRIGEKLIADSADDVGRNYANSALAYYHWKWWDQPRRELIDKIQEDLAPLEYSWKMMTLGDDGEDWNVEIWELPGSEEERQLLIELREEWREQLLELEGQKEIDSAGSELAEEFEPVFKTIQLPEEERYRYYQPVYWKQSSCVFCHGPREVGIAASEPATTLEGTQPFRVIKVTLPYKKTRAAIAGTRAVLIAAAILTIFLAMVALYVIVRYVIVKPLKHLRDVSDDISRGKTELRAEIHTNDEFEELADSFNRMLRHMTDAQTALLEVNQDLDTKVDELAQLNMRLYEMNRLKSDFLANMSHELRTPLNSIIGFSEVLQGIDSLNDKQKRYALNIRKSGRVLLEMINDILDLAKLEAGKMEVRLTEFRIDAIVAAQCDVVRALTEEKNIDLEVRASRTRPLYQDQGKVQQILTNLLSNAIKFTPEGGRITVSARSNGRGQLELSVADTGVGIPEEDREIIFEKFRQSKTVSGEDGLTREYSGTGLGLSIVKELCKLLGGEITFSSELAKGSTFTAVLPWTLDARPTLGAQISRKLDDIARPKRDEFETVPPVAQELGQSGKSR